MSFAKFRPSPGLVICQLPGTQNLGSFAQNKSGGAARANAQHDADPPRSLQWLHRRMRLRAGLDLGLCQPLLPLRALLVS
jgi:hypothetical protein